MRFIDQFTPENLTYAARLRTVGDSYYGFTPHGLLPLMEPGVVVDRHYDGYGDNLTLFRYPDGQWATLSIAMGCDRNGHDLEWGNYRNESRLDLFFKSFIEHGRTVAPTLVDLFEVTAAEAVKDIGEWNRPSGPARLACMILTSHHPDAEAVRVLYGLGGHAVLQELLEENDIDLDDADHVHFERGRPVTPART